MSGIDFPLQFDWRGRTAETTYEDHVRDLVEQVLFTYRGERVMRPGFGAGLMHLVHEPSSDTLAGSTELLVQGALQQWLGELIEVSQVAVDSDEGRLAITVRYAIKPDGEERIERFERGAGP
jgi:uncharacterized protein